MMSEIAPNENPQPNVQIAAPRLKKYKSAYILFSSDCRKQLKQKYPDAKNSEITKLLGIEWKQLDNSIKEHYYQKESEEKEEFNKMKELNMGYKYLKTKKKKIPLRFRTPYMFFIMQHKEQLNNLNKHENIKKIKELSSSWKEMTNLEKQPFISLCETDKKRHLEEWNEYMGTYFKSKMKNLKRKEKVNKMIDKLFRSNSKAQEKLKGVINIIKNGDAESELVVKRKYTKKKKGEEYNNNIEKIVEKNQSKAQDNKLFNVKKDKKKKIQTDDKIKQHFYSNLTPLKQEYKLGNLFEVDDFIDTLEMYKGNAKNIEPKKISHFRNSDNNYGEFFQEVSEFSEEGSNSSSDLINSKKTHLNKKRSRSLLGAGNISNSKSLKKKK